MNNASHSVFMLSFINTIFIINTNHTNLVITYQVPMIHLKYWLNISNKYIHWELLKRIVI
jgi:hypothetical protein